MREKHVLEEESLVDERGVLHYIHSRERCRGPCPFHRPSTHLMDAWPVIVRETGLVERLCKCGIGHPDPDSLRWLEKRGFWGFEVHACCACHPACLQVMTPSFTNTAVLFLDMDGVVNSARFFEVASKRKYRKARGEAKMQGRFLEMIDPETIPLLNEIVSRSGASVVISSTWRIPWTCGEVAEMLRHHGFVGEVIGATPTRITPSGEPSETQRGTEIQTWLSAHPEVRTFVILDDSDDMAHLRHRLVRTTWEAGLTAQDVERALQLFGCGA